MSPVVEKSGTAAADTSVQTGAGDDFQCEKCGRSMQDATSVLSDSLPPSGKKERRTIRLLGWRCPACGHTSADPLSKLNT